MSDSAPPPASASRNGTSTGSSSPPLPTGGTPPPPDSESPPPSDPPPSSPVSASDAASQPPSSLQQNGLPPPSLPPPAPPPANSSPPPSNSVSPPVPQALHGRPPLSASPPPQAFHNSTPLPIAPGQPASPSKNPPPTSQDSLPSTPPPVTSSPNPENSPVSPPPDTEIPLITPPSRPTSPPVTEEPVDSPVSPTLPETAPSTSVPSPSTSATAAKATPSTTPDAKLPSSGSQLGPPSPSAHTSSSSSNQTPKTSSGGLGNGTFVGITLAGAVLLVLAIFFLTSRKNRRRRTDSLGNHYGPPATFSVRSDGYYGQVHQVGYSHDSDTHYAGNTAGSHRGYTLDSPGIGGSKSWFTYEEIADMTQGFSRENLLGQGGFGCVHKGWLPDGREVAVKQLKSGSGQGEREFRAEVEIISRVHHRHLVSLVGYSIADNQRSLVYEFVPNNTLEHHLHGRDLPVLDWPNRLKIAIGSARGLAYLHEDCHPRIIHRDIKSANILLDNSFEAQVADFGLAKLSNDTHTHVSTRVMGTFGYMAPEYASSGKLTDRSDVFSFGVVLLELITGRKPVDASQPLGDESLVEWDVPFGDQQGLITYKARPRLVHSLETGDFQELTDPRLENKYIKSEMFRMVEAAAACVRHSASKRPRMVQVFRALDNEGELADLSNGVKFGQSTVFESRQYSADIQQFRRMAFGSLDSSSEYGPSGEYDRASSNYSSEHSSAETPFRPSNL